MIIFPWILQSYHLSYYILVRLADGNKVNEGRVEIYRYGYGWGTICDDSWGVEEAAVVCGMLGYDSGVAYGSAYFGPGVGEIFIDDVWCGGHEVSLWDCSRSSWGEHGCSHREDAGVRCGKLLSCEHSQTAPTAPQPFYPAPQN